MAHRIDVELTSARDDGTWTWRVAGARQPKGVVEASLVPEGAKVGDVLRVEADFELDGIFVTAVLPSREKQRPEPERLEVIGPPRETRPPSPGPAGPPPRPERRARTGAEAGDRPGRDEGRQRRSGPGGPQRDGRPRRQGPDDRARRAAPRSGGEHRAQPGPGERPDQRPERRERRSERPTKTETPRSRRLTPGDRHRSAVLDSLPPEHRPVAEQVLRGGIPAVRQAVEAQNAQLRSEGQPEVNAAPLIGLAEQLLPRLSQAEWRDRAEAAAAMLDEVSLRDLRSVVAGADAAARDDETRLLASTLRETLRRRVDQQRESWITEITTALDEGRLVRALRLSARPPDPGTRFPPELATRMAEVASSAMGPDVAPERWATVLEAVAESPVRRSVKPAGLPVEAGAELLQAARQASGRVPGLAPLLGIDMPPPPGPPRPRPPAGRPPRPPRPRRPRPEREAAAPPAAPPPAAPSPAAESAQPGGPGPDVASSHDDVEDAVLVEELGQPVDKS